MTAPSPTPADERLDPGVSDLGVRLKRARTQAGLSLAQVGSLTAISASFLSTVEKGKSDISIGRLMRLVHCYRISISDLVEHDSGASIHVVTPKNRDALVMGGEGITISVLAPDGKHMMLPVLNEYDVAGHMEEAASHEGEEFIFVLDGAIELQVEGESPIVLGAGHSAYYAGNIPHSFRNVGKVTARFIGVATPPNI